MASSTVVARGPPPRVSATAKLVMQSRNTSTKAPGSTSRSIGASMRRKTSRGREAELRRQAELLGRDGEPALQHQPRHQRHVEEDMRQHHAAEPVDVEPRRAQRLEPAADDPGPPPDRRRCRRPRRSPAAGTARRAAPPAPRARESAAAPAPAPPAPRAGSSGPPRSAPAPSVKRSAAHSAGPSPRPGSAREQQRRDRPERQRRDQRQRQPAAPADAGDGRLSAERRQPFRQRPVALRLAPPRARRAAASPAPRSVA